jgi:hypothetical protein
VIEAIKQVIEKNVMAYGPNRKGCTMYMTDGVRKVADELGVSYKAADELVRSWIQETF